jgi:hypothetical protein
LDGLPDFDAHFSMRSDGIRFTPYSLGPELVFRLRNAKFIAIIP